MTVNPNTKFNLSVVARYRLARQQSDHSNVQTKTLETLSSLFEAEISIEIHKNTDIKLDQLLTQKGVLA